MSATLAILVLLNNYVHDVATGLLLLAAVWLFGSARDLGAAPAAAAVAMFRRGYARSVRVVGVAVVTIAVTGAVRAVFFMQLEWLPAFGRDLVPVLVVKHVLLFATLAVGIGAWITLRRRLRPLLGPAAVETPERRPHP